MLVIWFMPQSVLQLSGRPVAKCDLWSGRATQILPNTGPTGNPRISFAKVHVRSSQTMQPCWTCGYQTMHIFFSNIFMSDHPKFVWTIQHTNWVVRWATQDFSWAAALLNVLMWMYIKHILTPSGIILCLCPVNRRRCYNVTLSLIGWAHTQNDPCTITPAHMFVFRVIDKTMYAVCSPHISLRVIYIA